MSICHLITRAGSYGYSKPGIETRTFTSLRLGNNLQQTRTVRVSFRTFESFATIHQWGK